MTVSLVSCPQEAMTRPNHTGQISLGKVIKKVVVDSISKELWWKMDYLDPFHSGLGMGP